MIIIAIEPIGYLQYNIIPPCSLTTQYSLLASSNSMAFVTSQLVTLGMIEQPV